ncbi:helix-turn-helix domain-containing protein [Micromonospora humidisoli]|uniref:Helix-turn-helix domain-containing protein n=1 Tax=Micromonospora humidisoli TaxID=2807622 RepID=A0ABS2JD02_9ACTN|nr:helix-turn-helix domain-containing protein [Micromonospora humidisoli]MBM7083613.1 helix-turn-helix domain-containing protein [Micromonospora humidisoli]
MTEPISAAISAAIAAARTAHGGTRDDVAAAARAAGAPATFTAAALRNLEIGRRSPSVDDLLWLAAALNVPVRQLLAEHADLFGHEAYRPPECGAVEDATRSAVEDLGELTGRQEALAQLAYSLAADIDGEGDRRQPAQLARALTDTLDQLWQLKPAPTEEEDGLGAE